MNLAEQLGSPPTTVVPRVKETSFWQSFADLLEKWGGLEEILNLEPIYFNWFIKDAEKILKQVRSIKEKSAVNGQVYATIEYTLLDLLNKRKEALRS